MAKFTTKFVRDELADQFIDLNPESVTIYATQKSKSSGKKVKVPDKDASIAAIERWLMYYSGTLDTLDIFEAKWPDGIADIINDYKAQWERLRAYYEKKWPDEYAKFAEDFSVSAYDDIDTDDESDEDEDDDTPDYSDMSVGELRKECKERGIKWTPKDKADALIAKLEAWDEENAEEDDSDEADEDADAEDEESEDEEGGEYDEMSLGELRKECKARGIKYGPRDKADALIERLEAWDEENAEEDESEEDEDEAGDYDGLSLGELRKIAKDRGIKYSPKTTSEDLIAKLEEYDEENSDEEDDSDAEDTDDESDEDEDDDTPDYSDMSVGELRKECKERGIKWTPKDKADALIAKLEADNAESEEDEDEDSEDDSEEVSEEELDEILDEEFEDETLEEEEEKAPAKGKRLPPKPNKKK